jgi:(R,R)-butanediol dehydrogenase/meso-butanediol dehydrogenase/diacetyl reductase
MRAAVFRAPGVVEVTEIPVPVPGDRDVLVRVAYCGVCGTDLHLVLGEDPSAVAGSVYGHEWSGEVVATGRDVRRWSVGDRVVGGHRSCGTCGHCRSGRPSLCRGTEVPTGPRRGGFAELTMAHEDALVGVGDGLELRGAALAEPLAVALRAVNRSGVTSGDRVLVTGGGPIGLLAVATLVERGIRRVVVSEPVSGRRTRARRLGATAVAPHELPEAPGPLSLVPEPFDAAIECSGDPGAAAQALAQLGPAGRLVLVGATFEPTHLDLLRVLVWETEIIGSRQYDPDGFDRALALLGEERVPWRDLVEEDDTELADLMALLSGMHEGRVTGKPLVVTR